MNYNPPKPSNHLIDTIQPAAARKHAINQPKNERKPHPPHIRPLERRS
jgi:hypothetical protein